MPTNPRDPLALGPIAEGPPHVQIPRVLSQGLRVFARNSGMFYLAATHESNNMMKRLARRMEREGTWDQTAYNEEQFYPAHDTHASVGALPSYHPTILPSDVVPMTRGSRTT